MLLNKQTFEYTKAFSLTLFVPTFYTLKSVRRKALVCSNACFFQSYFSVLFHQKIISFFLPVEKKPAHRCHFLSSFQSKVAAPYLQPRLRIFNILR